MVPLERIEKPSQQKRKQAADTAARRLREALLDLARACRTSALFGHDVRWCAERVEDPPGPLPDGDELDRRRATVVARLRELRDVLPAEAFADGVDDMIASAGELWSGFREASGRRGTDGEGW